MTGTTPIDSILQGNSLEELPKLPDNHFHSIVTDPPYELGFMGKSWDASGIAYNIDLWKECLRVLRPGGYLLAFGGSRTYHRMACAIEDAGFIVHPMIAWVQGQGFPKATNLSKQFEKDKGILGVQSHSFNCVGDDGRKYKKQNLKFRSDYGYKYNPIDSEAIQWDGWYYGRQSLKPAIEPIGMFQKPPDGRMVDNVRAWGCGRSMWMGAG